MRYLHARCHCSCSTAALLILWCWVDAFAPRSHQRSIISTSRTEHPPSHLCSGRGIAKDYSWQEEAFEIDVTVKVPKDTRAKDIKFRATSRSVDLRLQQPSSGNEKVLLDGNRKLRGRVSLDGTYWVISDAEKPEQDIYLALPYREVTVTIEKMIRTPKDDFEVVDYDWKGVYLDDDDEVSYRKYDGPEELDVHEYAAGLGVDLDNMNMSMVDKTMFSSGLNLTQSSLDELNKAGLLTEVTQQSDGSEFVVNPKTGEPEPLDALGRSNAGLADGSESTATANSRESQRDSASDTSASEEKKKIPFLDTNSPWHTAVPLNETAALASELLAEKEEEADGSSTRDEKDEKVVQLKRHFTRAAFAKDAAAAAAAGSQDSSSSSSKKKQSKKKAADDAADPIDLLTVKKLKEILRSQGLKVSGNKKELQDRLRQQVNGLLQGNQQQQESSAE